MISFLNNFGEEWLVFAKLLVIQNSLFLGFVFLALFLLKNASAQVKYCITLIGLFKLILPPFIPSPFIKSRMVDVSAPAVSNPIEMLVVFYQSITKGLFLSNTAILYLVWMILAISILLIFVVSTIWLKFKLRNSSFLQIFDNGFEKGNSKYKIYQSKLIKAPLTIGFFPKKIFVPENWQEWSADCKRMILSHELAHIKRHDGIVQFVQIVVQAIYFFHPLVWLLNKYMNKYREMACDDLAVSSSNGSAIEYSKYLTEIAEKMVSNRYKFIFASTILRLKFELLSRIQYQMKEVTMKRISRTKLFMVVAGLLLFILPLSLTSSQQKIKPNSEKVSQEKQKKKSLGEVFTDLFPLPEGGMKSIQKNIVYPDEAKKHGVEGKVVVNANVNTNGDVENVNIVETTFDKNADYGCHEAAINAVKKAKWSKSSLADLKDSEAGFEFKIPVVFALEKNKQKILKVASKDEYSIVNYNKVKNSEEVSKRVVINADLSPMPVGGMEALRDNLEVPDSVKKAGKNVKIYIDVLIDESGDIVKISLEDKNVNSVAKKAAIDAIKSVKWKPGKHQNKTVKTWVKVPVEFRINW